MKNLPLGYRPAKSLCIFLLLFVCSVSCSYAQAPVISYVSPQYYTTGVLITPLYPTNSDGLPLGSYTVNPTLPAGLVLNSVLGIISGTPDAASPATNYTITYTNSIGSASAILNITIGLALVISYPSPQIYTVGVLITPLYPTNSDATHTGSYAVSPALPAGLALDRSGGFISGTPNAASPATDYKITYTNTSGSGSATLNIKINPPSPQGPVISYPSPQHYTAFVQITTLVPTNSDATRSGTYAVNPALPQGINLDPSRGVIYGSPNFASPATDYTITYTNSFGSGSAILNITVAHSNVPPPVISYASPQVYTVDHVIPTLYPTNTDNEPSGRYTASPTLPEGLSFDFYNKGFIYGIPTTVSPATDYTITYTDIYGTASAIVNIEVLPYAGPAPAISYSSPQVYKVGVPIKPLFPTSTGGDIPTNGPSPFSISSTPPGLSFYPWDGELFGIPSESSPATNYTITATNSKGSGQAIINIEVKPFKISYPSPGPYVYTIGSSIAPIAPLDSTSYVDYSISPALPAGLALGEYTGTISGTPRQTSPLTNYKILAEFSSLVKDSAVIAIQIDVPPKPNISYTSPDVYTAGTTISPLSPVNTGGIVPARQTPLALDTGDRMPGIVAADGSGNVYVANGSKGYLRKIAPGGTEIFYDLPIVTLMAVDNAGDIYYLDNISGPVIHKQPAKGSDFAQYGSGYSSVAGLATDLAGNLYLSDYQAGAIKKIPPGGGAAITVASGFTLPLSIAADRAGNVYVVDGDVGRVQLYKVRVADGSRASLASNVGNANIAVDVSGNVYYLNTQGQTVEILAGGGFITIDTEIVHPSCLAVDSGGNLYLCNSLRPYNIEEIFMGGYYINKPLPAGLIFNQNTGTISGTPFLSSPATDYTVIATNSTGSKSATFSMAVNLPAPPNISYSTPNFDTIGKPLQPLSPVNSGGAVATQTVSSFASGFNKLTSVAASSTGNIYVFDAAAKAVQKIPVGGGTPVTIATGFNNITGMAADVSDNVFLADFGNNTVKEIPADGSSVVTLGSGFTHPYGIAIDGSGEIYVTDQDSRTIKKMPAGGGTPVTITTGLVGPSGIAVDMVGNLYVADGVGIAAQIKEIPISGGPIVTMVDSGVDKSVAIDATGNIFYAQPNGILSVRPMSGASNYFFSSISRLDGLPLSITLDGKGNLYAAGARSIELLNAGGYSISELLPPGLRFDAGGRSFGPTLPAGTSIERTGTISGTPISIRPAADYIITAKNAGGSSSATVNIQTSSGAFLASLIVYPNDGFGNGYRPYFSPAITSYHGWMSYADSSIHIHALTAEIHATVRVNGRFVTYGGTSNPIHLSVGDNIITIIVTAKDGVTTKTYTLTETRAAKTYISGITLSQGTLSPVFFPGISDYSATEAGEVGSITVTPLTSGPNAAVTVNGAAVSSGSASAAIPLSVGSNTVTIVLTAAKGVSQTVTINVTRLASTNNSLASLSLSTGALSPAFNPATTSYSAGVDNEVSSVSVTAVTGSAFATLTVNGETVMSGTASGNVPLNFGLNVIPVTVTAQNGTANTYTINITRGSSNNNLASLRVTGTVLSPAFAPGVTGYTSSVANSVRAVQVTPVVAGTGATVTVNGVAVASGMVAGPIPLNLGLNYISIVVTAQNGLTKTYTLSINRAAPGPANSTLDAMSVTNPIDKPQLMAEEITVHQGVSPNGDGINDFLLIDGITNYPDNTLTIVNRAGQVVFEAKNYDNSTKVFDGHSTKTGAMQLPGTYFYSLDYSVKGLVKHKTGYIVLKY